MTLFQKSKTPTKRNTSTQQSSPSLPGKRIPILPCLLEMTLPYCSRGKKNIKLLVSFRYYSSCVKQRIKRCMLFTITHTKETNKSLQTYAYREKKRERSLPDDFMDPLLWGVEVSSSIVSQLPALRRKISMKLKREENKVSRKKSQAVEVERGA